MADYSSQTMEAILERMLNRVPDGLDKREGSVIYDALAPAAAELAQLYAELELNEGLSFADTATGEYLTRITAQFGVNRRQATFAKRKGLFYGANDAPLTVPVGSRYAFDRIGYVVTSELAPPGSGAYELQCEVAGQAGNRHYGELLPLQVVNGLVRAVLDEVLSPGEDEEDDEALRARYYAAVNEPAFGGNAAQYKSMINAMDGVGAVKIYPVWQGGGTVRAAIIASDWGEPSAQLVAAVQEAVDPPEYSGKGIGMAPIGHEVTIAGVQGVPVDIATTLTLASGMTPGQVQAAVEEAVEAYLLEIRKAWSEQPQLIVRVAQIDARILTVEGVVDVNGTLLNGAEANLTLGPDDIPLRGTVTLHA